MAVSNDRHAPLNSSTAVAGLMILGAVWREAGGRAGAWPRIVRHVDTRLRPLSWPALAVFECLQLLRQALWDAYGPQVQQAWREQLLPDGQPPEFDPNEPF